MGGNVEENLEDEMDLNMQRTGQGYVLGDRNKTEPPGTFKGPEARTMCNASELPALGANVVETAVRASAKRWFN